MYKIFRWNDHILLGGIFLYLLFLTQSLPLSFDESYNLQVPLMLLKEQKYETIYHARSFDGFTTISTGPTVLIPIYLIFRFLGIGLLQARIVQYFYVTALIGLIWAQSVKYYKRIIGLVLLLILYSMPTQLQLGLSVLGELPALFFVFLGITLWGYSSEKYQKLSILVMGLSAITKLYFVIILCPMLALLTIRAIQTKKPINNFVKEFLTSAFLFLLPLALWETSKFFYLGYHSYRDYLAELVRFITSQQISSEDVQASHHFLSVNWDRFIIFSIGIFPGFPEWLTGILLCGIFVTSTQKILRGIKDENIVFSLSLLIFVTYFLWFVFISPVGWWRYIYPFSILFLFLLGDFINGLVNLVRRPAPRYTVIALFCLPFVLYVLPFVINQYKATQTFSYTLSSQREFAGVVKSYREKGYWIGVDGWWQAPEISFLSGVPFFQFICGQEQHKNYMVIYAALEETLVPEQATDLRDCLGKKVFESEDKAFSLYRPKTNK
jgi:4-amino-4-deoxy-L-arabinose transferase-like glycosyltransferase